jgi:hypothetical protein
MNRAILMALVPAALVAAGYFLMSAYAGVELNYPRIIGAAVALAIAVYGVHRYRQGKSRTRASSTHASH